jgi:hypothetical protein
VAVKTWLLQYRGVGGRWITTNSCSEAKPIAPTPIEATTRRAGSETVGWRSSYASEPVLQAGRRQDLMEDITMPHCPLGLMITLALAFLWGPLVVASPPSGTSASLLVAATAGLPERRTALVIGNAAYQDTPRRTAAHDAIDMATALRQLDFQVLEWHDATRQRMDEAIAQFTRHPGSDGVAVFYFSGKGVQVHGVNYLLPVDARLSRESDLEDQAILGSLGYGTHRQFPSAFGGRGCR